MIHETYWQKKNHFKQNVCRLLGYNCCFEICSIIEMPCKILAGKSNTFSLTMLLFVARQNGVHSSTAKLRSNLSRYYIQHCDNSGRKWIRYRPTDELCGVCCEDFLKDWPRYNGTALYFLLVVCIPLPMQVLSQFRSVTFCAVLQKDTPVDATPVVGSPDLSQLIYLW